MSNYFSDNKDLLFQFSRLDLKTSVAILEDDYSQSTYFDTAPTSYEEAMEFYFSALELVGDLSCNYFEPRAEQNDKDGSKLVDGEVRYAKGTLESVQKLAESGLMGVLLPRKFGGGNIPATIYTMMIEMLSQADASLMTLFGYQDVGEAIAKFGTEDQARIFLEKYCSGEHIGAMVLTEPHAGSDLQSVKLKAYQNDNGEWFLSGTKCFISNGCGDVLLVLARSEPNTNNMFGLSMFACHGGDKVKVGRVEEKLGLHASPTCELNFEDAPAELIGKRKFGLIQVLYTLNHARFSVAAQALGIAEAAYLEALTWSKERVAFGEPIYNKPSIANMLISMRVKIESSRSFLYSAVQNLDLKNKLEEKVEHLKESGARDLELEKRLLQVSRLLDMQSPMVKYHVTEVANKVCFDALQVHGGAGYVKESKMERLYRDVRITNIYEGTSQVQVIGAVKGANQNLLADFFQQVLSEQYSDSVQTSIRKLNHILEIYNMIKVFFATNEDKIANDVAAKEIVDIYCSMNIGCLLLNETKVNQRKEFVLIRFVNEAYASAKKALENVQGGTYTDLNFQKDICDI